MQIHELTKRRLDELNLLKNFSDAITAAKTGYAAGKAGTGSTLGAVGTALGTFGKAITSPGYAAQSDKDANKAAAMQKYNDLKDKYGWADKPAAGQQAGASQQAAATPQQAQQQVKAMVQQFTQEPEFADLTAVLPDPGKMLYVHYNQGGAEVKYYKDESGIWRNEYGTAVKNNSSTAQKLESYIDSDNYEQVPPPGWAQKQPDQKLAKGASKGATPAPTTQGAQAQPPTGQPPATDSTQLEEAAGRRNVKSIVNNIIKKNKAAELKAQKAMANPQTANKLVQAQQAIDKAAAATATNPQAKTKPLKRKLVQKAFTNYATLLVNAGGGAPDGAPAQPGQEQPAGQATPQQKQIAAQTLSNANLPGPEIVKAAASNPKVNTALKTATSESHKPLAQRLEEALSIINEVQVHITKDIRVRTSKGDYVKRASDQTWYDPNGVPIDPVKYADYVAKLDKTPQAQTQYQADAQKAEKGIGPGGTDAPPAQPPQQPPTPPTPPQAAAPAGDNSVNNYVAQQQMLANLRADQIRNHNAIVADTVNQLRNAEIFGTGQKDYLQQRLAQLIATKY